MKLITISAASIGALALAACTPAEKTEEPPAAEATVVVPAPADGAMTTTQPDGMADPDASMTPPGQTPPTLPPEPDAIMSPTTSPPPM